MNTQIKLAGFTALLAAAAAGTLLLGVSLAGTATAADSASPSPGGKVVLTCPYDWSSAATPLETWLGGHSQRSPAAGSSEAALRALLTAGAHPGSLTTLTLAAERDNLAWYVRLHDRSTMTYKLHLIVATRSATTAP